MRHGFVPLLLLSLPFLASCVDQEEEYFLNPDGSGKVIIHSIATFISLQPNTTPSSRAQARVEEILSKSKGIDAWSDVSFAEREGKLEFQGTAYFRDVAELRLAGPIKQESSRVSLERSASGNLRLVQAETDTAKYEEYLSLSKEDLRQRLAKERADLAQVRPMLEVAKGFRYAQTWHLPGTLEQSAVFETGGEGLRLSYTGEKMLAALDAIAEDDAWWDRIANHDGEWKGSPVFTELHQQMFGVAALASAEVGGDLEPLFDYEAEMEAARAAMPAMLAKLGLNAPASAGQSAILKNVRVAAVQIVRESDDEQGIRPFNATAGYRIAVLADLPGTVLAVKDATVATATTDTGMSLLPEREWDREIHFPSLTESRDQVLLEIPLTLPGPDVKLLRELSGELTYLTASGVDTVDLGEMELTAGATGKAMNAKIAKVSKSDWRDGYYDLDLEMNAERDHIAKVRLVDASGVELPTEIGGRMSFGKNLTLTLQHEGPFPKKARILVDMHAKTENHKVTWKLTNVDLLGR